MSTFTITTSDVEDAAIKHVAGEQKPEAFLDRTIHQLLGSWAEQCLAAAAPRPAQEVAHAYLLAPAAEQQQVLNVLHLPTPGPLATEGRA